MGPVQKLVFVFAFIGFEDFFLIFELFFSLLGYDTTLHIRGRRRNVQADLEKKLGHIFGEIFGEILDQKLDI